MRREEVDAGFWCGNLEKRGHLEDLGVDGTITLKLTLKKWGGKSDVVQNRETWRAAVNVIMNLLFP
jgi:hypothetical protein